MNYFGILVKKYFTDLIVYKLFAVAKKCFSFAACKIFLNDKI